MLCLLDACFIFQQLLELAQKRVIIKLLFIGVQRDFARFFQRFTDFLRIVNHNTVRAVQILTNVAEPIDNNRRAAGNAFHEFGGEPRFNHKIVITDDNGPRGLLHLLNRFRM